MEITIYDCESGETITRPMTDEEAAEFAARQKKTTEEYAKLDEDRAALLQKIGLTENELRSLLG